MKPKIIFLPTTHFAILLRDFSEDENRLAAVGLSEKYITKVSCPLPERQGLPWPTGEYYIQDPIRVRDFHHYYQVGGQWYLWLKENKRPYRGKTLVIADPGEVMLAALQTLCNLNPDFLSPMAMETLQYWRLAKEVRKQHMSGLKIRNRFVRKRVNKTKSKIVQVVQH